RDHVRQGPAGREPGTAESAARAAGPDERQRGGEHGAAHPGSVPLPVERLDPRPPHHWPWVLICWVVMKALDARSRTILKEIIRVHVDTGRPVSSRTLFKSNRFHLSPASIRNIMADLTDSGFLTQPHTSAGRVPTDRAYRLYIDELMRHRKIAVDVR